MSSKVKHYVLDVRTGGTGRVGWSFEALSLQAVGTSDCQHLCAVT